MQKQDSISVREQSVYVPGIFTDKQKRHASHYDLLNNKFQQQIDENKAKGYPKYREDFSTPEQLNKPPDLKSQVDEMMNQLKQVQNYERHEPEKEQNNSPYKAVVKNFILAKKLAKENLEHVPLPDTIVDTMYRKKQMQGDPSPGLVLKDGNCATGVGWKGYPGFGATRCTKLKVFRPKTSVQTKISKDNRPSSTSSFDIKWRFIRQQKVSPMDLAICWDMTPVNPNDEPKKPIHIDGSNGSQAPAVFSLVHTPKYEDQESGHDEYDCGTQIPSNVQRPEALFEKKQSYKSSSENSSLKRVKSAYNIAENCSKQNPNGSKNKIVQSTPDLTANSGLHCNQECYKPKSKQLNSRLCLACEMKNIKLKERPKSQYKMAFKAGVPNNQSVSSNKTLGKIHLKVPKQRDPYSKKNYAITSLAPPFSLQREKRQDYPEHWRLATVYQHSYKPMHLRKKSLLRNVFQ